MSTLLEAGFSISSLGIESAMQVADFLEATLAAEGGTAGFGESPFCTTCLPSSALTFHPSVPIDGRRR